MIRNTMCDIFFMISTRLKILSMIMIDNIHVRLKLLMLLLFNLLQLFIFIIIIQFIIVAQFTFAKQLLLKTSSSTKLIRQSTKEKRDKRDKNRFRNKFREIKT